MKCPYCDQEMTLGYIQSRDGVYWSSRKRFVAALPPLRSENIRLGSEDGPMSGAAAEVWLCRSCKKMVIDYADVHDEQK